MAEKRTVVYEVRVEEGQMLESYENVNLKLQQNRERRKEINTAIAANVQAVRQLTLEISSEVGATEDQNAELERLRTSRLELNRQQAEAIIIDRGLSAQARELGNDLSGLTENSLRFRDKMADANLEAIKQSGIMEALDRMYSSLEQHLANLNERFKAGQVTQEEYAEQSERISTALVRVGGDMQAVEDRTRELSTDSATLKEVAEELEKELKKVAEQYATNAISAGEFAERTNNLSSRLAVTKERIEENGRSLSQELGARALNSLKDFAVGIGAAFAVDRLIQWGAELRERGIEIEQITARAKVLFGDGFAEINAAAEANGEAIGRGTVQYLQLASVAADALTNIGFSQEQVTSQSQEFVQAAADIEDFTAGATSAEQAMEILKNAALGNTKGLRELNIPIKSSAADLKDMADNIQATEGVTRAQAEATANLRFAFDALNPKIEAFKQQETGADEAADRASAQFQNQSDALAQSLTPAFTAATSALSEWISGLVGATNSADGAFAKFAAFAGAASNVGLNIVGQQQGQIQKSLEETSASVARYIQAQRAYTESIAGIQERIAKVVLLQEQNIEAGSQAAALANAEELASLREKLQVRLTETAATVAANKAKEAEGLTIYQLNQKLTALKEARTGIATGDTGALKANAEEIAAIEQQIKAADEVGKVTKAQVKSADDRAAAVKRLAETIQDETARLRELAAAATPQVSDDNDAEIGAINAKYAKQLEAAKGYGDQLKQIEQLRDEEIALVRERQQEDALAALETFKQQEAEALEGAKASTLSVEESKWEARIALIRQKGSEEGRTKAEIDLDVASAEAQRDKALLDLRLQRIDVATAAERQKVVERYEALFADADLNDQSTLALQKAAGDELFALDQKNAAAKVQLAQETSEQIANTQQQQQEAERQRIETTGATVVQLLGTLQDFSDAQFDSKIRDVASQTEALQTQLNNTTNEPEKARIKERIEGLAKEKKALEDRKKSEQGFAVAAALISTYLAAQQVFANPAFVDPITKAIAAGATIAAGLLNVAKIQGFDQSGIVQREEDESGILGPGDGRPIRRANGDNLLVTAQVGEMFVNKTHQERAQELYGKDVWRNIGIPGFAGSGIARVEERAMRLQGFADSGLVSDLFLPQPPPMAITQVIQSGAMASQSDRPIVVSVVDINDGQSRAAQVEELSRA